MLYHFTTQKYPPVEPKGNVVRAYCIFALASRGISQITAADIEQANQLIIDTQQGWAVDSDELYWRLPHLAMIGLDANMSSYLTAEAREAVKSMLFDYSRQYAVLSDIYPIEDNIWKINDSDNHNLVRKSIYYCTSLLLKDDPLWRERAFDDGSTLQQHYDVLTDFLPEYFQQRAMNGIQVEFNSPSYSGLYLMAIFAMRDCTDSPVLRTMASKYLDLLFAEAGMESLNGIRGGAAVRSYKDANSYNYKSHKLTYYNWLFSGLPDDGGTFTVGNSPFDLLPACVTDYRLPLPVINLYTQTQTRGDFEYTSTRLGRGEWFHPPEGLLRQTLFFPTSVLRHTYITPEFTIGTFTLDETWPTYVGVRQNHWMGIIGGDDYSSRVYVQAEGSIGDITKGYNDLQAVGSRGAAIIRRSLNIAGVNVNSGGRRLQVFFSEKFGYTYDASGWIFAKNSNSAAYLAVRAVHKSESPGYSFSYDTTAKGDWITVGNLRAFVILDIRKASDYVSFQAFKDDILDNQISWSHSGDELVYSGSYGDSLTMFGDARLPKVNGTTVDLNPPQIYSSPYLRAQAGSYKVCINDQYGNELTLNFGYCNSYHPGDINFDCIVDVKDFAIIAAQWLQCNDPENTDCF